ncbi:uncharacterized protein LOC109791358 isoform X2 [Cajanus cajan]|uniref:uncharacterized protein LOC109791358 isoform X1 n=1 Tax=Cajanus cajan TaxID=3821 RepID=UPI00098DA500|nr:uncharacterized protein LOC109791358 isoform X1 [Cajanus cajan]XP_020206240.1 uncharacterized protein LOC109791358 isoform X2 [Cajanus cajan]
MINSQGMVLATAMALSGTVIVLALRLQRSFIPSQFPLHEISQPSTPILRSCISSDENKRGKRKKQKKRVHFADDVVDSCGNGEEFRRQQRVNRNSFYSKSESKVETEKNCDVRGMPANRVALYNGILRDRVAQRLTYSY